MLCLHLVKSLYPISVNGTELYCVLLKQANSVNLPRLDKEALIESGPVPNPKIWRGKLNSTGMVNYSLDEAFLPHND